MPRIVSRLLEIAYLKILQQNEQTSKRLRSYFSKKYDIDVGMYSYGCFDQWRIARRTVIGRYCSFAKTVRVIDANHPLGHVSSHPSFYEASFGVIPQNLIEAKPLVIGDDVWIGHNALLLPGCKLIGRGAVIAAGAVVTGPVSAYQIVAGVPARHLRSRFDASTIAEIEASRWWTLEREELGEILNRHGLTAFLPNSRMLAEIRELTGSHEN